MAGQVNIQELPCKNGRKIGIAELDNPSSLNALSYDMLVQLHEALLHWQDDDDVVCVFLHGVGEKAFCAGGDVRSMYQVMDEARHQSDGVTDGGKAKSGQNGASSQFLGDVATRHSMHSDKPHPGCRTTGFLTDYFALEYTTDYMIHTYPKPVVVWGQGIVMGGGIGLYIGASHRISTPSTRLAMPEITIGLYPDVGGTWFLNRLPQGVGLFLGLTGAQVNATDALALSMTEHVLLPEQKPQLLSGLQHYDWEESEAYAGVTEVLDTLGSAATSSHPDSQLIPHLPAIQAACQYGSLSEICRNIQAMPEVVSNHTEPDKWLQQAKSSLAAGSPITAHICYRQITQFHEESLADCFRMELTLSVRCGLLGEFYEGVKARLIEKTGQPNWRFKDVDSVDIAVIEQLFTPLWADNEHPLQQLGLISKGQPASAHYN